MNTNPEVMSRIMVNGSKNYYFKRAQLIKFIRSYLDSEGYLEVETPILYPYPEIAPMEQFRVIDPTTERGYYMRVCPTEHLKRLMVAGFDKVYEFSRNFRPGNTSPKHSSEFTSLECSRLGADYKYMMVLTESLVYGGIATVKGDATVRVNSIEFDVTPPWDRVTVRDAIKRALSIDILEIESVAELRSEIAAPMMSETSTLDECVDTLIAECVLPGLSRPTFLTEYPYTLGGPAQCVEGNPLVKQRCEAFIGTMEIANMSTHLNDMERLMTWHRDTIRIKEEMCIGDAVLDGPLFEALSLGLPHSAVVGIGIDRAAMLAAQASSIDQVILFPFERM